MAADEIIEENEDDNAPDDERDEGVPEKVDEDLGHSSNLVLELKPEVRKALALELIGDYEEDYGTTEERQKLMKTGLDLLGMELKELDQPFPGACSASHPMMLEAAVQFQARAIQELFPAEGPVRTRIMGTETPERIDQAQRVREYMNYQLTEEMEEYFDDLDSMLFKLPLFGSCIRKVYYDTSLARPVVRTIPEGDFITNFSNTDIRTAQRVTHVLRISANERRKLEASGFYEHIDTLPPPVEDVGVVQEKIDKIEGRESSNAAEDDRYELLEIHTDLDLEGFEDELDGEPTGIALPYIVTVDKDAGDIISIRRNWEENDPFKRKLAYFVHYRWLPGIGFYGNGLVHLMGNLQRSATTALRSLIDAGQFATLPAGFKMRGARMSGGTEPIRFGEFRDLDAGGDDIRKNVMPLPIKEPSATLFQLLSLLIDDGRRLASITDLNVGDSNQENPVGTTLAMLEQGLRVMTGIHKRLHKAQGEEFKILKRLNREFMPDFYPYDIEGKTRSVKKADFSSNVDVLPVSDPNIFSETQRIMRAQAQLQIAQQFPQQHNLHEALMRVHEVIGTPRIQDILVPDEGPKPMDPLTEEYSVMHAKPVMAYPWQDHKAHLQSHMAFLQNPQYGGNPQVQQIVGPAMMAHIAEHMAHQYRMEVAQAAGIQLPPPPAYDPANPNKQTGYTPLPPELENLVAKYASPVAQHMAQQAQQLQQLQQNQQAAQNPEVQAKMQDSQAKMITAQAKMLDVQQKHQGAAAQKQQELQIEQQKAAMKIAHERTKMQLEAEKKQLELRMKKIELAMKLQMQEQEMHADMAFKQQEMATDLQVQREKADAEITLARQVGQQELGMQREQHEASMQMDKERGAHELEQSKAMAKIKQSNEKAKPKAKPSGAKNG